jgi:hypothetical protein
MMMIMMVMIIIIIITMTTMMTMTTGSRYSYHDSGDVEHELLVSSDVVCIAGLIQVHGQGQTKGRLVNLQLEHR